ncbi:MAG TPA: hypothetical protein VKV17_00135 [Bryobacteraceae bacterium]|nr:hypothetical protein [Bryobacteraceae bacterium]
MIAFRSERASARPHTDFIEVGQQTGGILVDPVCPGALQLVGAVAAGKKPNTQMFGDN